MNFLVNLNFFVFLFFEFRRMQVYAYHKSLPMPITAHKFGSIDPVTGKEIEDDNGQFVSSVCWRKKSNMVVAANSSGCIKLLQLLQKYSLNKKKYAIFSPKLYALSWMVIQRRETTAFSCWVSRKYTLPSLLISRTFQRRKRKVQRFVVLCVLSVSAKEGKQLNEFYNPSN